MERTKNTKLSKQVKRSAGMKVKEKPIRVGNTKTMISTGSTLLDLAISGTRVPGGGLPGGIMCEVFGPEASGKTVLLSEIAGAIQRKGGKAMFHDPEARLNKQFAAMFDVDFDEVVYETPDTVNEVFKHLHAFEPEDTKKVNGIMADSLTALSTKLEMDNPDGDKMGMKRAKDFSEGFRKTARIITQRNILLVCSNQIRENADAGPYGEKYKSPGGKAIAFYSSVRLKFGNPTKIRKEVKVKGKVVKQVIGVETEVTVYKNSVDKPYRTAPLIILFDYGIDDVRANLQFLKTYTGSTTYTLGENVLGRSMEDAIRTVEEEELENTLKKEVISLWEEIQSKFDSERKKKKR